MADSDARRTSPWALLTLVSFAAAAAATALYDMPLFGNPAADLRHAVPAPLAFFTFLFLGWVAILAPVVLGAWLLMRSGLRPPLAILCGVLVLLLLLLAWPWGRYALLKGRFLNGDGAPQLLFIRETRQERPTLVLHGAGSGAENVLSVRIRDAGLYRAPQLFRDPFYPEPDFDAFVSVELEDGAMRELARRAVREILRRPRPVHLLDPEADWRELHTCVLVKGESIYGVSVRPGGLEELLGAVEEALPAASRERLKPWTGQE